MRAFFVVLLFAAGLAATPAAAAQFEQIYVIPGVTDNGGGRFSGLSTVIKCVNLEQADKQIRFTVSNYHAVYPPKTDTIEALAAHVSATHATKAFVADLLLTPGTVLTGGQVKISATGRKIHCTAMIVDARALIPGFGVSLHMVRYNPAAGAQE
jgi:hypothetical protein